MVGLLIKHRSSLIFGALTSILFLIMMLVEQANGRFWLNDFRVFYDAAQALVSGEQVYGVAFGLDTGFYKYSPFTLLLFVPFTLLPFSVASAIQFWLIVMANISLILLINKLINKYIFIEEKNNLILFLGTLIVILNHLIRELHLGNTNIILLLLLTLALHFVLKNKTLFAALLLATVILTKPYFVVLVLPFILHKKWSIILKTGVAILGFMLISTLLCGYENGLQLYHDWVVSMGQHSGYLTSSNTISSLIQRYFSVSLSASTNFMFFGISSVLLFIFFWFQKITTSDKGLLLFYFILIATLPNLLITDTEHFILSTPIILLIISYLIRLKKYIFVPLFVLVCFMYGGNSSDMFGAEMSDKFYNFGILGIGNLMLIATVLYLIFTNKLKSKIEPLKR